jgi:hypothetical protein
MELASIIGKIPYRLALAGGWIDQPVVSRLNPDPPGSMVVVSLEPDVRYMDRCGMATGTRAVALRTWGGEIPDRDPGQLVRELYAEENKSLTEPSGSQDMIGLIYPGVSRLDYDAGHEGGLFPVRIESNRDPLIARWIEDVVHLVPVMQRPAGYRPLGVKNLDPSWIARLGRSGRDCYAAVVDRDIRGLAASMGECMRCWEAIFPQTLRHPAIDVDLAALLAFYQARYRGAMYSGCGGGYLLVASEEPVPGSLRVKVRL